MPSAAARRPRARPVSTRSRRAGPALPAPAPPPQPVGYWALSVRPLHVLAFLTPLIVLYEVGSVLHLSAPAGARTIQAKNLLAQFFETFGLAGVFLPGAALVTVLVVWHVLTGDRWRVRPGVLAGMLLESAAWMLPLLVMGAVHLRAIAASRAGTDPAGAGLVEAGAALDDLSWQARLTIAVGAGLYEEMLFRLVTIALFHFVLADLLRAARPTADVVAVAAAAVAFALYHDTALSAGGTNWPQLAFLTVAGAYLGTVYFVRGLGIVVATHALYDVMVLVFLRR